MPRPSHPALISSTERKERRPCGANACTILVPAFFGTHTNTKSGLERFAAMAVRASAVIGGLRDERVNHTIAIVLGRIEHTDDYVSQLGLNGSELRDLVIWWVVVPCTFERLREL